MASRCSLAKKNAPLRKKLPAPRVETPVHSPEDGLGERHGDFVRSLEVDLRGRSSRRNEEDLSEIFFLSVSVS